MLRVLLARVRYSKEEDRECSKDYAGALRVVQLATGSTGVRLLQIRRVLVSGGEPWLVALDGISSPI